MKKILDRTCEQDEYFKRWLVGLAKEPNRTMPPKSMTGKFFIGMTPTEQIKEANVRP